MKKTEFKIPKMDCSAEEQLIRLTLKPIAGVQSLHFDLTDRKLEVYHSGELEEIRSRLARLNLGAILVAHNAKVVEGWDETVDTQGKGSLIAALSINGLLFMAEFIAGILAYSLGLIADSFDMLADAIVYGMALTAVGGGILKKATIARFTGYFQGFLACAGLVEVVRRGFVGEGIPDFRVMIILSIIALIGNGTTLLILNGSKNAGVHMQAAWICTSVDVQVNALVIASAVVVYFTGSRLPDLVVGGVIFLLVANGARKILSLSR